MQLPCLMTFHLYVTTPIDLSPLCCHTWRPLTFTHPMYMLSHPIARHAADKRRGGRSNQSYYLCIGQNLVPEWHSPPTPPRCIRMHFYFLVINCHYCGCGYVVTGGMWKISYSQVALCGVRGVVLLEWSHMKMFSLEGVGVGHHRVGRGEGVGGDYRAG